jgi:hypothetical protein
MKRCLLLCLSALALSPTAASAGFIGVGDFSPNARVVTYDNLGLPFVNETPLVISGDAYTFARALQALSRLSSPNLVVQADSLHHVFAKLGHYPPLEPDSGPVGRALFSCISGAQAVMAIHVF